MVENIRLAKAGKKIAFADMFGPAGGAPRRNRRAFGKAAAFKWGMYWKSRATSPRARERRRQQDEGAGGGAGGPSPSMERSFPCQCVPCWWHTCR